MQPNKSPSPWDSVRGLVTAVAVVSGLIVILGLVSFIPASGFSAGDSLEDQLCVTTSKGDALFNDESTFGKATSDGVTSTSTGRAYCKPYNQFERPYAAQALAELSITPMAIAILGLSLGLRRIIARTWETGPFHLETVRLLNRFRWWIAGAVALALAVQWSARGIKLRLLTDEPWSDVGFPWPIVIVWVTATVIATHCETVARRLNPEEPPHEDGRV